MIVAVTHCGRCRKMPHELSEYVQQVEGTAMTPAEYVQQEEGTYNRMTGRFLCTECYIAEGMPNGVCNL